jgi:hypothetical protein
MMMRVFVFLPAVLVALIIVFSLWKGRAFDLAYHRPLEIVDRHLRPREYWSTLFALATMLALALWIGVTFS